MTEDQKIVLQKKRAGILTEAEYDRYLEYLRNDPDFREDAKLDALIEHVLQQEADERRWNAVEIALAKKKQERVRVVALRQRAVWAVAASLVGVAFGVWWWQTTLPTAPQLLSNRNTEIFLADSLQNGGRAYMGGDLPIGTLPTLWQLNPKQTPQIQVLYCEDTLRLSVRIATDTVELANYGVLYDSKSKKLFLKTPTQKIVPLDSCKSN